MKKHNFKLEPYKGPGSRYDCPACGGKKEFTRYINVNTGEYLDPSVGICNNAIKCGYHKPPRQFFKENPGTKQNLLTLQSNPYPLIRKQETFSIHEPEIFERSRKKYDQNNIVLYLEKLFGHDKTMQIVDKYRIGTSNHWHGATVFWQIDRQEKIRAGKIMLFDKETGKRVKKPYPLLNWVHSVLKIKDFSLKQCFFGEHLINEYPGKPIAIVESEKTAMICSVMDNQMVWLAAGNLNGLTVEKCKAIQGKKIILFPDLKCYEIWKAKARLISGKLNLDNSNITTLKVSDLLEKNAGQKDMENGYDLADYLTKSDRDFNGKDSVLLPPGYSIETLSRDGVTWTVEINEHGYPASWDN